MTQLARLVRRSNTYYFRVAVPQALTEKINKREIKLSLRTSNVRLARIRVRMLSNSADLLFEGLLRMIHLSDKQIHELVRDYFRESLAVVLEQSRYWPDDPRFDIDAECYGLQEMLATQRQELRTQKFPLDVEYRARELIRSNCSASGTLDLESVRTAMNGIQRAKIESCRILAARLAGNCDETAPRDPLFAGIVVESLPPMGDEGSNLKSDALTVDQAAKLFCESRRPNWVGKTLSDNQRVITLVSEILGAGKPLRQVNTNDIKAFRDALKKMPTNYMKSKSNSHLSVADVIAGKVSGKPLSWATQDKYFVMMRQFFNWAVAEELIDRIPGEKISIGARPKADGDRRVPYTEKQLHKIFNSPIYRGCKSASRRTETGVLVLRDGYFWIPLIALYSGMRMGEIVQMRKADLRCEAKIWYFDVNQDEGKSLKSVSSKRLVPVAQALIEIGLIDHFKAVKADKRLFSDIQPGKDGYYSHNFSKWWGRYSRTAGFCEPKTAFHSFRHNFKDGVVSTGAMT